ncbi:MAG TPA: methyltransferase domain-containing protein [Gaiellaceae bacterium]|jgi:SAM-dependent methyltransferase
MRPYTIAAEQHSILRTAADASRRRLPPRYGTQAWDAPMRGRLERKLRPGMKILDVGAGSRPFLAPSERPDRTVYVGLDADASELARAPAGAYDETVVAPAETPIPSLEASFDLVVSFLALEHVTSAAAAVENARVYLRPGGALLAQLAGRFAPASFANRVVPQAVARRLLRASQGRAPETVFPARYDQCTHSALVNLLSSGWTEQEVLPLFTGAGYVLFSRALCASYIAYEEWACRGKHLDLAPYYLIAARRAD